ncbi:hypothetical protein COCC4DRAFT_140626 [Bipolaris maydis ATCC 48331]|uniref:Uncharacterized protein n=2 Tax=Cochliobolus heterostrophus TaxID=5016 RepID=M2VC62_COCH5|nr:uncharacterized protein COCC4DRAFT_140626 [Bipolaris maydis ATCC 48331]EMD97283.1 hypothetical protein COCHEDRAFT_1209138 [Bipolaris maydis C5]KAJ5061530.1 hypothetical protein J3E74DRAFT_288843 [Bipolaris maydis]ENI04256.1 hypothetical protein COCC4DRAFT_140626 [Bipolaris maydis ATCC 48331]KAJ6214493.1 hypothetical protein PSV09DRAFT_1209138 [Bipolaris maydis]KAJ6275674.1 hypothetical protein PSV08DRAFT_346079 [Bipolaris maydis]
MGLEGLTAWPEVLLRTVRGNRLQAGRSRTPESYRFQSLAQGKPQLEFAFVIASSDDGVGVRQALGRSPRVAKQAHPNTRRQKPEVSCRVVSCRVVLCRSGTGTMDTTAVDSPSEPPMKQWLAASNWVSCSFKNKDLLRSLVSFRDGGQIVPRAEADPGRSKCKVGKRPATLGRRSGQHFAEHAPLFKRPAPDFVPCANDSTANPRLLVATSIRRALARQRETKETSPHAERQG